jgi:hypothetical protein
LFVCLFVCLFCFVLFVLIWFLYFFVGRLLISSLRVVFCFVSLRSVSWAYYCQCFWMVFPWLNLRFSLTFISPGFRRKYVNIFCLI